jgi:hypothetical protein
MKLLCLLPLLSLLAVSGCILSPEKDPDPPDPTDNFKPLTTKENVLYNLVQSYKFADIEKYQELLHLDYIWRNQDSDIAAGKVPSEFFTRDQDIQGTHGLFKAFLGTHPDPSVEVDGIELTIQPGAWQEITEVDGSPCEDCWETSRIYEITVRTPTKTWYGNDLVKFIVVPVDQNGQKLYKLRRGDDILSN